MDHNKLLDLAIDLGCRLQLTGAETYRVEESVTRLLAAYGVQGEAYSIPNCLIVSLQTEDGANLTRMRRVDRHGTDLDLLEQYSGVSRRLCAERPPLSQATAILDAARARSRQYKLWQYLLGCALASAGFALFFKGTMPDAVAAALGGILCGLCSYAMDSLHTNEFFKTVLDAFLVAACGYGLALAGLVRNMDAAIIGPLTMLVPGFLFTNSMRDIIYGDTMSGVNRVVQVFIISAAIAIGTGFALGLGQMIWGFAPDGGLSRIYSAPTQCLIALISCLGFCILFNIHGLWGMLLCTFGSALGWGAYLGASAVGFPDSGAYLLAAVAISAYAEAMARIRKYPATSYLVISLFPLFPGAYLYYGLSAGLVGNMSAFSSNMLYAAETAGSLAVGVLLVSSLTRMWGIWKKRKGVKLP